jgi:hypothetical protein
MKFQEFSDQVKPPSLPLMLDGRPKKQFDLSKFDQDFGQVLSGNLDAEPETTSPTATTSLSNKKSIDTH